MSGEQSRASCSEHENGHYVNVYMSWTAWIASEQRQSFTIWEKAAWKHHSEISSVTTTFLKRNTLLAAFEILVFSLYIPAVWLPFHVYMESLGREIRPLCPSMHLHRKLYVGKAAQNACTHRMTRNKTGNVERRSWGGSVWQSSSGRKAKAHIGWVDS